MSPCFNILKQQNIFILKRHKNRRNHPQQMVTMVTNLSLNKMPGWTNYIFW